MKKIILSIVLAMALVPAMAQRTDKQINREAALEPEFNDQACILNADSTTTMLPMESVRMKGKSTYYGLIPIPGSGLLDKNKMYLEFQGEKSTVTIKPGTVNIILKEKENGDDPRSSLGFMTLEVKKKKRRAEWMSFGLLQGSKMDTQGSNQYEVRKFGKSSYLITIRNLQPGQYALGVKSGMAMATFGVE